MKHVVIDCETDGFDPTVIWCLFAGTEEFRDKDSFNTYLEGLEDGTEIYAHNGFGFDYPIISRLWGTDWERFCLRDSLVLSRLANPSRSGGHSLAAWGARLGFPKGDHSDWSHWSQAMSDYCAQDVQVTERLLKSLEVELAGFSQQCIDLEHDVARIIEGQRALGWKLDEELCFNLLAELKERKMTIEDEVHETFKPHATAVREVIPKLKKAGGLSVVGLNAYRDDIDSVAGPLTLVDYPVFNLGSRKQIGEYLVRLGWRPKALTPTGQPIVDEGTLEAVTGIPEATLIAEYLMLQKRIAQVQSWLEAADSEGRVHGRVNSIGAVTRRMTHNSPNMAQTPALRKPYGLQCRQAWTVKKGCKLVGADASGLELRCLAHYMGDEDYMREVVDGDIHTANQLAAGLDTRDQAKTFIYAFLYGAGDAKIGDIAGGGRGDGKRLKARFLANTPALATLRERVERASQRGWLKTIDGGRVAVRSEHAALNTLLQSAGAVFMKKALVIADDYATRNKLDFGWVGNIHDEVQAEVKAEHALRFARITEAAMVMAGEELGFRCPMAGEAKIGANWAETH